MPRAAKICAQPGCPAITTGSYCTKHAREKDKARGTPEQRGYGHAHRQHRKKYLPAHAAGTLTCWRCKKPIAPTEPWDLGHDDNDRTLYRGPEHQACNRATNGRHTP